jgi:hypothetical protein
VALVVLQSAFGYGFPRFRHAADLVLAVLAAAAVVWLADRIAARKLAEGQQSGYVDQ